MYVSASYQVRSRILRQIHTLLNNNNGQIRLNLISHVFTLNMNFPGYQFLVEKSVLNGRNGTVFALRFCGPPSWMRERVRSRIKSRPSVKGCVNILQGNHPQNIHSIHTNWIKKWNHHADIMFSPLFYCLHCVWWNSITAVYITHESLICKVRDVPGNMIMERFQIWYDTLLCIRVTDISI